MTWLKNISSLLLGVLLLFPAVGTAQYDIPPKPQLNKQTAVYDYIDLLTGSQRSLLENKLTAYADSTSTQVVIAIISSTKGEDISFLGAKWGQKWGVGQAGEDNGIMILLAKDDRSIDINTGYGIEYRITDRMAERIINNYMIPSFKDGNYYEGLDRGTDVIIRMLEGEFKAKPGEEAPEGPPAFLIVFIIFFILIIILNRLRNRGDGDDGRSGGHRTPSLLDMIILSNVGRTGSSGGSFGGGFGGGGFGGGFGGGGFGGGGASGSW
jgi:uncharacterized protein